MVFNNFVEVSIFEQFNRNNLKCIIFTLKNFELSKQRKKKKNFNLDKPFNLLLLLLLVLIKAISQNSLFLIK